MPLGVGFSKLNFSSDSISGTDEFRLKILVQILDEKSNSFLPNLSFANLKLGKIRFGRSSISKASEITDNK